MDEARQVFQTLDRLKGVSPELFHSRGTVGDHPGPSHTDWHLQGVLPPPGIVFPHVRRLFLEDVRRLLSLGWLAGFPNLDTLWIFQSDNLSDLDGIEGAPNLRSLTIWPSMSGTVMLDSLAPLQSLTLLEVVILACKTRDGLLAPLTALPRLKTVFFPNAYPWEDIARFEARHPDVNFGWKGGVIHEANPGVLRCRTCQAPQSMLTGKGLRLACPACDATYIAKHLQRYRRIAQGRA
ncbi:MAG: hypothetical protein ACK4GO_05490 [Gemmobacter sp.]